MIFHSYVSLPEGMEFHCEKWENAEFHREKRGWWNSVLINKNMAFGVSKWCPQNATILYHFVGSTCHKSGSSPQRAESELCQKSGFQQTLTPLSSHRDGPMTIWTPLWHHKSDDFDSSSLWSLCANICCSLRSRSSDPPSESLVISRCLLWKIATFIAKFSTNGPWLP